MSQITVNSQPLEFDGKVAITLVNSVLSDSVSSSLEFDIEPTDNNIKLLGFLNRPDVADNKVKVLPAVIEFGVLYYPGTITARYQGKQIKGYLILSGNFWLAIKDIKLANLPWETIDLGGVNMPVYMSSKNNSIPSDFCFPFIQNVKAFFEFPFLVSSNGFVNHTIMNSGNAIIPFFFLQNIIRTVFYNNGYRIGVNSIEINSSLKKVCLPNNYMLNNYGINDTVVSTQRFNIKKLTAGAQPEVETIFPHGLNTADMVRFDNVANDSWRGLLTNKICQVEVIDTYKFKIINIDATGLADYERQVFHRNINFPMEKLFETQVKLVTEEDFSDVDHELRRIYFKSSQYEIPGYGIFYSADASDGSRYHEIQLDLGGDPNFVNHTWPDATVQEEPFNQTHPDNSISKLAGATNSFTEIKPSNHMPDITINDFLKELQNFLGIGIFVRDETQTVDIKLLRDVLISSDHDDISEFAGEITDVENPDIDGFTLSMQADSSDEFYGNQVQMQELLEGYNVKDPVQYISDLPPDDATNDVRLVTWNNAYYVCSRTFINPTGTWDLLGYNLLNLTQGNGDIKIETKCTPVLTVNTEGESQTVMNVSCQCRTFPSIKVPIQPRFVFFHGVDSYGFGIATSNMKDYNRQEVPGTEFEFRWDGLNGIYEVLLKHYLHWKIDVAKECYNTTYWPIHKLSNFDFSLKRRIRGTDYIVESIKFTLDFASGDIEFSQTKLIKC
jgi:hypothetical protein